MVTDVFSWLECLIQNQEAEVRLMQQQERYGTVERYTGAHKRLPE
jgi:hypothetical protein